MRVGGQLHTPAPLTPGKRPSTHCIGGWVGADKARVKLKSNNSTADISETLSLPIAFK